MGERKVKGVSGLDGDRQPDDLGRDRAHILAAQLQRQTAAATRLLGDLGQTFRVFHHLVGGRLLDADTLFRFRGHVANQRVEFQLEKQVSQPLAVRFAQFQLVELELDGKVIADRHQILREACFFGVALQRLARPLLFDFGGVREDLLERAETLDQLYGRLRSDAAHPGDIVRGVADQRQVVGDALGRHAKSVGGVRLIDELGRDGRRAAAPGVEQGDSVADELVEVLVPRHDHRLESCLRSASRQRA